MITAQKQRYEISGYKNRPVTTYHIHSRVVGLYESDGHRFHLYYDDTGDVIKLNMSCVEMAQQLARLVNVVLNEKLLSAPVL